MLVRSVTGILAVAMASVALSACTSSGSTNPQASFATSVANQQTRETELAPTLVGCLISKGLIPKKDVDGQAWYSSGHVTANNAFTEWFHDNNGLPVKLNGTTQTLQSVLATAANGSWPSICGPMPSTSAG